MNQVKAQVIARFPKRPEEVPYTVVLNAVEQRRKKLMVVSFSKRPCLNRFKTFTFVN